MNQRTALITGANGDVGRALCATFSGAGWKIIATDQGDTAGSPVDAYHAVELARLCRDTTYQTERLACLRAELGNGGLHVLINNAATQVVAPVEQLTTDDWHTTLDVNLISPFLLTQALLSELQEAQGSVINIASIHARLTKPLFTAYATSKAALVGLTRSLAVELGGHVRVNAICPAAIATSMLEAGFDSNPDGLAKLASHHPSGCIGTTEDVARSALFLAEASSSFLNGTVIGLDGGIASRLHDPD